MILMLLHEFCYLGENEQNKHNEEFVDRPGNRHLATTKWLTETTAHPRQI